VTGHVYALGNVKIAGELGAGNIVDITYPVPIPALISTLIKETASSSFHSLALDNNGKIWSWGKNEFGAIGRFGDPIIPAIISHVSLMYTKFKKVACGNTFSMAISSKGLLHTWGTFISSENAIIGYLPTREKQEHPRIVHSLAKLNIIDIAAGASHCLALTDTGTVYSWGCGDQSQLGRPTKNQEEGLLPKPITCLKDIVSISCGTNHSFAINQKGQVYAWGLNQYQQCGLVEKEEGEGVLGDPMVDVPALVPYFNDASVRVQSIAAGEAHSIALLKNNKLVVFGRCDMGQLGIPIYNNNTYYGSMKFAKTNQIYVIGYPIENLWRCERNIIKVVCGTNHTLILTDQGFTYGFGDSSHCQLGAHNRETLFLPTPLSHELPQIIHASAGDQSSLFVIAT
ncbi:regulator of chromosome condensation 1/beta-lactamase-inhibitor protein II, partial [Thamnidium elegans]